MGIPQGSVFREGTLPILPPPKPWSEWWTDAFENITLPQPRAVKGIDVYSHNVQITFLSPATKFEGNVFSDNCHSVHRGGWILAPPPLYTSLLDTWTWDTNEYSSQAGCWHPIRMLSCQFCSCWIHSNWSKKYNEHFCIRKLIGFRKGKTQVNLQTIVNNILWPVLIFVTYDKRLMVLGDRTTTSQWPLGTRIVPGLG